MGNELSCRADTYYKWRYVVNQCVEDYGNDRSVSFVCDGYKYEAEQHSDKNCGADSSDSIPDTSGQLFASTSTTSLHVIVDVTETETPSTSTLLNSCVEEV